MNGWRWLVVLALVAARFLFPGDVSFLGDEAQLISLALEGNTKGELVRSGLKVGHGAIYGPFAIWMYQWGLSVTQDLVAISVVKNALFCLALLVVLRQTWSVGLVRTPLFLVIPLLSPYLFFYGRDLWDNSWLIPLSGLALAAYIRFCQRQSVLALSGALLCLALAFLTHLMSLALSIGIFFHLLLFHRLWLKRYGLWLAPGVVLCVFITLPYARVLMEEGENLVIQGAPLNLRALAGYVAGFLNPFLGPRYFSFVGFDYIAGPRWWLPAQPSGIGLQVLIPICYVLSGLAWVPLWYGLWRCVRRALGKEKMPSCPLQKQLTPLLLILFFTHVAMSSWRRLGDFPHYFNAIWLALLLLLWEGAEALWQQRKGRAVLLGYVCSLMVCEGFWVFRVHQTGGNRQNQYGSTLANKIEVAKQLTRYPPNLPFRIDSDKMPASTAASLQVLRRLHTPQGGSSVGADVELSVRYVAPEIPGDGRIALWVSPKRSDRP